MRAQMISLIFLRRLHSYCPAMQLIVRSGRCIISVRETNMGQMTE